MGKCRNTAKSDGGKDTSPTPSSHGGEPCDTAQDQIEEVASMEEVLSQMGTSPKMPFRFIQLSRLPSVCSQLPELPQTHSLTPDDQMHYCIHIRVTLEEGRGYLPQPSHTWNGLLITDILQEACPGDCITNAVVLAPGEAILFFGRCSCNEGLLYRNAQDVELGLKSSITWAGRTTQVEVTVNTVQEGHRDIADAIMEEENKGQRARAFLRAKESYLALSCHL